MNDKLERFDESQREAIDEAIRTYRQEVEKMNENVEKLKHTYM